MENPPNFPYDVFLSHSSKDKDIVRPIAERLRADGLRVWFDEWDIKAGDNISAKIDYKVALPITILSCLSADILLPYWSALSASEPSRIVP